MYLLRPPTNSLPTTNNTTQIITNCIIVSGFHQCFYRQSQLFSILNCERIHHPRFQAACIVQVIPCTDRQIRWTGARAHVPDSIHQPQGVVQVSSNKSLLFLAWMALFYLQLTCYIWQTNVKMLNTLFNLACYVPVEGYALFDFSGWWTSPVSIAGLWCYRQRLCDVSTTYVSALWHAVQWYSERLCSLGHDRQW